MAVDSYLALMNRSLFTRLGKLSGAIEALKGKGWNVDCISPQAAIYLSLKIDLRGKKTTDGKVLRSDEDTTKYSLEEAGIALVLFLCFGFTEDTGFGRCRLLWSTATASRPG